MKTFTGKILLILILFFISSLGFAGDFDSIEGKLSYLNYIRFEQPDLYQDFILRHDAFHFLNDIQKSADILKYDGATRKGKEFTVFENSTQIIDPGELDLSSFRKEISRFVSSYPKVFSNIMQAFEEELTLALLLNKMHVGLIKSEILADHGRILSKPDKERLEALTEILIDVPSIPGLVPQYIGIDKENISGKDFLEIYQRVLLASENVTRLVWFVVFAEKQNLKNKSVKDIFYNLSPLDAPSFLKIFGQEEFNETSQKIIQQLSKNRAGESNYKLRKILTDSYNFGKTIVMPNWKKALVPTLIISPDHPYNFLIRGCTGDCSTDNSPEISLLPDEFMDWLLRADRTVKGYRQYTRVSSNGTPSLFLNTISGAGISKSDVYKSILNLFDQLPELGAKKIIIPTTEKYPLFVNYPEVAAVFKELAAKGQQVPMDYNDINQRLLLAPYLEDNWDQADTHRFGIEIQREHIPLGKMDVQSKTAEIKKTNIFKKLSRKEATILALELRFREENKKHLDEILSKYKISPSTFNDLCSTLDNEEHLTVSEYYQKIERSLASLGITIFDQDKRKYYLLLYKGHMNAKDGLIGENAILALEYIKKFLYSYTDVGFIYTTLQPHLKTLEKKSEFLEIVRGLFKKNFKELNRVLDIYEHESKSAYRVLVHLFSTGLSTDLFAKELAALNTPIEINNSDRPEGIFLRRKTFLSIVDNKNPKHFDELMTFLESPSTSSKNLDPDDLGGVSLFFSEFSETLASKNQIQRINNFLTSSEFGLSFTQVLGQFKVDKFNVPLLMERLLNEKKYLWAAYLIHKDPWPKHKLAPFWLKELFKNKDQISAALFIEGFSKTTSWLSVNGIESILDELLEESRQESGMEAAMARLLFVKPGKLTTKQEKWISEITNPSLRDFVKQKLKLRCANQMEALLK